MIRKLGIALSLAIAVIAPGISVTVAAPVAAVHAEGVVYDM